jgi:hypothetical protein
VTTKDNTGDQLMASIRKTKTEGTTPDNEPDSTPQADAPVPRKKAVAKATSAAVGTPAKSAGTSEKKAAAEPKAASAGSAPELTGYQSPGRVWPD